MCLYVQKSINPLSYAKENYGFKVFTPTLNGLRSIHRWRNRPALKEKTWYACDKYAGLDKDFTIPDQNQSSYHPGWHVYKFHKHARQNKIGNEVIMQVKIRKIITSGLDGVDNNAQVIVVKHIYIIPDNERVALT